MLTVLMDLRAALENRTEDETASVVAFLVLSAGDGAEVGEEWLPHLRRFIERAGLEAASDRQAAVDADLAKHPVPADLLALFDASVAKNAEALGRAADAKQAAAGALLARETSNKPVGTERVEGAVRGGMNTLLHARTTTKKK